MPWNAYGDVRGLNAPPRIRVAPCVGDFVRDRQHLLARFDAARTGRDNERAVADHEVADLYLRARLGPARG